MSGITVPKTPPPAKAAGISGLPAGILRACTTTIDERVDGEIDASQNIWMPLPARTFCNIVAEEYEKWFLTTHAGIMIPRPAGLAILKNAIRSYDFTTWGPAWQVYWSTTVWLPAGVYITGKTTNHAIQAVAMQAELTAMIAEYSVSWPGTMEVFANRIANILYTYTTGLLVLTSLTVPPYFSIEKVM